MKQVPGVSHTYYELTENGNMRLFNTAQSSDFFIQVNTWEYDAFTAFLKEWRTGIRGKETDGCDCCPECDDLLERKYQRLKKDLNEQGFRPLNLSPEANHDEEIKKLWREISNLRDKISKLGIKGQPYTTNPWWPSVFCSGPNGGSTVYPYGGWTW